MKRIFHFSLLAMAAAAFSLTASCQYLDDDKDRDKKECRDCHMKDCCKSCERDRDCKKCADEHCKRAGHGQGGGGHDGHADAKACGDCKMEKCSKRCDERHDCKECDNAKCSMHGHGSSNAPTDHKIK